MLLCVLPFLIHAVILRKHLEPLIILVSVTQCHWGSGVLGCEDKGECSYLGMIQIREHSGSPGSGAETDTGMATGEVWREKTTRV